MTTVYAYDYGTVETNRVIQKFDSFYKLINSRFIHSRESEYAIKVREGRAKIAMYVDTGQGPLDVSTRTVEYQDGYIIYSYPEHTTLTEDKIIEIPKGGELTIFPNDIIEYLCEDGTVLEYCPIIPLVNKVFIMRGYKVGSLLPLELTDKGMIK